MAISPCGVQQEVIGSLNIDHLALSDGGPEIARQNQRGFEPGRFGTSAPHVSRAERLASLGDKVQQPTGIEGDNWQALDAVFASLAQGDAFLQAAPGILAIINAAVTAGGNHPVNTSVFNRRLNNSAPPTTTASVATPWALENDYLSSNGSESSGSGSSGGGAGGGSSEGNPPPNPTSNSNAPSGANGAGANATGGGCAAAESTEQTDLLTQLFDGGKEVGIGLLQGFFIDGAKGTVDGVGSLVSKVWNTLSGAYNVHSNWLLEKTGLPRNSANLMDAEQYVAEFQANLQLLGDIAKEYGPFAAAVLRDLFELQLYLQSAGNLGDAKPSEMTKQVISRATSMIQEVITTIKTELDCMTLGQKERLMGRISGLILFEVAIVAATGGVAAAAKAGRIAAILNSIPGISPAVACKINTWISIGFRQIDSNGPDPYCFVGGTPVSVIATHEEKHDRVFDRFDYDPSAASYFQYELASTALLATQTIPIESVPLGSRVTGENPNSWEEDDQFDEPNERDWRRVIVDFHQGADGTLVTAELLRPLDWIQREGLNAGVELVLSIRDLTHYGRGTVRSIDVCPPIQEGAGQCVVSRYVTHTAQILTQVRLEGGTEFTGTPIHPIWSEDRQMFVKLGWLRVGERLRSSSHGTVAVASIAAFPSNEPVYNLEIQGQHVYEITDLGILVHNADNYTPADRNKLGNGHEVDTNTGEVKAPVSQATRYKDKIDDLVATSKPSQRDLGDLPAAPIKATSRLSRLTEAAKALDYRITNFRSHEQPVFTNGKTFISPDVDGHNVTGGWKMARTVEGLRSKATRMGTYGPNLTRIGD